MKIALLSLISALLLCAQDVRDVMGTQSLAVTANTLAATITAAQGDGTICKLTKNNGGSITMALSCVSGDGKTTLGSTILRASGANSSSLPFGAGDVFCLIGINPTVAAILMGSLGSVPANGVAWSCSTNIRTAGSITGQTVPVSGSVTWP